MKRTRNLYHFQFRKCKKSENLIAKNRLLDACINGTGDIFTEIKRLRCCKPKVASNIDGEKDDIPGHFKKIYDKLYNSGNYENDLRDVLNNVESRINFSDVIEIERVTPDVIKEAF